MAAPPALLGRPAPALLAHPAVRALLQRKGALTTAGALARQVSLSAAELDALGLPLYAAMLEAGLLLAGREILDDGDDGAAAAPPLPPPPLPPPPQQQQQQSPAAQQPPPSPSPSRPRAASPSPSPLPLRASPPRAPRAPPSPLQLLPPDSGLFPRGCGLVATGPLSRAAVPLLLGTADFFTRLACADASPRRVLPPPPPLAAPPGGEGSPQPPQPLPLLLPLPQSQPRQQASPPRPRASPPDRGLLPPGSRLVATGPLSRAAVPLLLGTAGYLSRLLRAESGAPPPPSPTPSPRAAAGSPRQQGAGVAAAAVVAAPPGSAAAASAASPLGGGTAAPAASPLGSTAASPALQQQQPQQPSPSPSPSPSRAPEPGAPSPPASSLFPAHITATGPLSRAAVPLIIGTAGFIARLARAEAGSAAPLALPPPLLRLLRRKGALSATGALARPVSLTNAELDAVGMQAYGLLLGAGALIEGREVVD